MKILTNKKWKDGFLDYHKSPKEYRIKVTAWKNLEELKDVYHTRPKSLRLLWNYFPVVGFEGLRTKVWSRLREDSRNEKYVSCGIGEIIETADDKTYKKGGTVAFVAPLHPAAVERVAVPKELIFSFDGDTKFKKDSISYINQETHKSDSHWWNDIKGWSMYSGTEITEKHYEKLEEGITKELEDTDWDTAQSLNTSDSSDIATEKGKVTKRDKSKKSGVVFGFGNYAKINIIPYCREFVDINTVHEIDPTQIFPDRKTQKWDTAPLPHEDEKFDVYFVASYNNTHSPISLHALKQDAYALIEKPVVNDYDELDKLEKLLKEKGRKVFIGFHKRYGEFNKMAREDLNVEKGDPISYHSVVYELVQPEYFWYNWPVSRSTFFANGCHQVDHFLHLNDFSKPVDHEIKLLQDNSVLVWIELENGAVFTTIFSEKGSSRVGPRDYVELKVPGRDVRIIDNIKYMSETSTKKLREKKVYKTHSYRTMYKQIGKKIANNEPGDSIESIMVSTKLMLDLEEKLQKLKNWGSRYDDAKKEFWRYFDSK